MAPIKAKPGASASDPADAPQSNQGASSTVIVGGESLIPLQAPEGATSCTIDGQAYEVADGRVSVLERHVEPLRAIGFSFVAE